MVAPLAGAWIEIRRKERQMAATLSLPLRERGLKYKFIIYNLVGFKVAPLAGAWIEIS